MDTATAGVFGVPSYTTLVSDSFTMSSVNSTGSTFPTVISRSAVKFPYLTVTLCSPDCDLLYPTTISSIIEIVATSLDPFIFNVAVMFISLTGTSFATLIDD